ncbi:autotransporter outer membrane beta-barrel domain-containing protein [Aquabacter spiritensis]|nr:autotransporter outer membrane beta-barrel domain-containing protein [Aquabacter spiritensis]
MAGPGNAIELGSVGGQGGYGDSALVVRNIAGKPGGDGNYVSLNQYGSITGGVDLTAAGQLILLYSRGGIGGAGLAERSFFNPDDSSNGGGIGAGGRGGQVVFETGGSVHATGNFTRAVYAVSQGGDAGAHGIISDSGTVRTRIQKDAGGASGGVSITLTDTATLTTQGANAAAVFAAANGGAGGNATSNRSTYYASEGGMGGRVVFLNHGRVATYGDNASAVILQSVGGKGGNGGGGAFSAAAPGAAGGNGGVIQAVNFNQVQTAGAYSFGIMAQSVGGVGGRGSSAAFGDGADGGAAGTGGGVTLTNEGVIQTWGRGAAAIIAQSIGGGNALDAFEATSASLSHEDGAGGRAGIWPGSSGGTGGDGGTGGVVQVFNSGSVTTAGAGAYGVLAQSVGGGGGTGGVGMNLGAFLSVGLGGSGGGGGDGGVVTFSGTGGHIRTTGAGAIAILAQSVGGGGGTGGYATTIAASPGLAMASAVGGAGGGGGNGKDVTITNQTSISTWGENADAIRASSIGGGGGNGGNASAYAIALPLKDPNGKSYPSVSYTGALGGASALGGSARAAIVVNGATIETLGTGSIGIHAESIGGGGGNGGNAFAYGLAISAPDAESYTLTSTIGGKGGAGGSGYMAKVTNQGDIFTYGDQAFGILAQSIGGGGGNAGSATATSDAVSLKKTIAYGQTIGGAGGNGGNGQTAYVTHHGLIQTDGDGAMGIGVQSIGGGGGNGGSVSASAKSGLSFDKTLNSLIQQLPLADAITATTAIGGQGGGGGSGGEARADIMAGAVIRTYGSQADGVFAQSIGGGGGTGGGGSVAANGKWSASLSIGGKGGGGGSGGVVNVDNRGTIETYGDVSHGVFAESVGGGGGTGGSLTADKAKPADPVGKLWGVLKQAVSADAYQKWAADKGNAETKENLEQFIKDIQNTQTYKDLAESFKNSAFYKEMNGYWKGASDYLKEQSKNSVKRKGDASLTVSLGGEGGAGNVGGTVKVDNFGLIRTEGDMSYGVFAQSIGGGGGQGGLAYSSGSNKTNIGGTLGGNGGSGNTGGEVKVTNTGSIVTLGDDSYGLYAQSVGGGGGIGVGATSSDNKNLVINATLGGKGGSGNKGKLAEVTNSGSITTFGDEAHAIVVQSVGGGGGAFIMNPATGDTSSAHGGAPTKGEASEEVSEATAMNLLKAVGIEQVPPALPEDPDKKPSNKSGNFTLGGSGGTGADGDMARVIHSGSIVTSGEGAIGILAQSIGGGGGISNAAGSTGGVKFAFSMGGSGGGAGNGGRVEVTFKNKASVRTAGDYAPAVLAQSIGGGGGYGGSSVAMGQTIQLIGGKGGSSGSGAPVNIYTDKDASLSISTTGVLSHGIFAQSLGGGGGSVSSLLKTDPSVRATLQQVSEILTGISKEKTGKTLIENIDKVPESLQGVVRLLGNDKDTVDDAIATLKEMLDRRSASQGTGGPITMLLRGSNISATGPGSFGLFAQSGFQTLEGALDPTRYGEHIKIEYEGTLVGGTGGGAAIGVDGGNGNTITIYGGSTISALSGTAILSSFGVEEVGNYGTVVGDIDLSVSRTSEFNSFSNWSSGIYRSGGTGTIRLGNVKNRGLFHNVGTFDIGGVGTIATATVENGRTELGGRLLTDVTSVAAAGTRNSDLLITETLEVRGVAIAPHAVKGLLPGSFTVVTASDISNQTQAVSGASSASPISWTVSQGQTAISITPSANFIGKAGGNITNTERSALNSLQAAWNSADASMAGTFADMANVTTVSQYQLAISSLSTTESIGQPAVTQTLGARRSLNAALSCPVFEGEGVMIRETQCLWTRVTGSRMQQFDGGSSEAFTQNMVSYRMGGQWEFAPDWFVGATAAFNNSWSTTADGLNSTNGDSGDASIALKHQAGAWLFAGALHGGYGNFDSNNYFVMGSDTWQAENSSDVWTAALRLRASYEFTFSNWYLRPYADVDVLYTYMPGYTLTGDGATFHAGSMEGTSVAFEAAMELGTRIDLGEQAWLRPFAVVGMTFVSGNALTQDVSFSDGGGTGINFTSTSAMPDQLLDLGAGLQLMSADKYELRGEYRAQIADYFLNQELNLRMAVRF